MEQFCKTAVLPTRLERAVEAVPLAVTNIALMRLVDAIRRNHPEILDRMGVHAVALFLIDPVNLPIMFCVQPMKHGIVECVRRTSACAWDARISGPIAALIAMIHGRLDGDALFFSRDIVIEGDTEAVVTLRNAIDAAEIDLTSELAALFGPLKPLVNGSARIAMRVVERLVGLPLLRDEIQTR